LFQKPGFYNFDLTPGEIVSKYLRSQDIYDPDGKIKDRIFEWGKKHILWE